ncbi:MAG: class I SAM-dependent methyltransferase [Sulfolobus sp.]|nr:class I SAM-dependent methyltransferase [Sulfolobus sp.]
MKKDNMFDEHPELSRIKIRIENINSRYPPIMRMGISVDEMIYIAKRIKNLIEFPVLDFMCGNCLIAVLLSKLLNMEVSAIDNWSQFPLEKAEENVKEDQANVKLYSLDDQILPFPSLSFNTVYTVMYISNLKSDKRVSISKEINRILKDGGKFLIVDTVVFRSKIRRDLEKEFKLEWYAEENGFSFFLFRKFNSYHT